MFVVRKIKSLHALDSLTLVVGECLVDQTD
jgi:hypothetical protein